MLTNFISIEIAPSILIYMRFSLVFHLNSIPEKGVHQRPSNIIYLGN